MFGNMKHAGSSEPVTQPLRRRFLRSSVALACTAVLLAACASNGDVVIPGAGSPGDPATGAGSSASQEVSAEELSRVDLCAWADLELSGLELFSQRYERGLNGGADIYPVLHSKDGPRVERAVPQGHVMISCDLPTYGSGQDSRVSVPSISIELEFDPASPVTLPEEDEVDPSGGTFFEHRGVVGYADFPAGLTVVLDENVALRLSIPGTGSSSGHHESIVPDNYRDSTEQLTRRMIDAWVDGRVPYFTADRTESARNAARVCEALALDFDDWSFESETPYTTTSNFIETTDNPGNMYYYDQCWLAQRDEAGERTDGISVQLSWLGEGERLDEWERLWVVGADGCEPATRGAIIACDGGGVRFRVISGGWFIEFNRFTSSADAGGDLADAALQRLVVEQGIRAAERVAGVELGLLFDDGWWKPVPDDRMVETQTSDVNPDGIECESGSPQVVVRSASVTVGHCVVDGTLVGNYRGAAFAEPMFVGPAGTSCTILGSGERLCFSRIDAVATTSTDGLVTSTFREYLDFYWYDQTQVG